jgi:membrane fusion protein (multidrug efflux system)
VKKRFIITAAVLLFVFGGLAAFNYVLKPEIIRQVIGSMPVPAVPVTIAEAKTAQWRAEISAIGTLEAVRGVTLSPQVAGRVEALMFRSGQSVKAGESLLKLDDSIERAQLAEAQADLRLKELALRRSRELAERGNTAQANLDRALAERDVAEAQTERIRAQIGQKTIVAPFDGRLGIRLVNLGQFLPAGTAIVSLQATDPVYVNFSIPERDLSRVAVGQTVRVTLDGLGEKTFPGTITSLESKVDQATRNLLVQATLDNQTGLLVPGMFAHVRVELSETRELVVVPETAVTYSLYGDSVYVVVEKTARDGKPQLTVERRFVRVGERSAGETGLSEGVKPGERVVTSGQLRLQPDTPVVIDTRTSLTPPAERPRP